METTQIIKNKHCYKVWYINFIRQLIADPQSIEVKVGQIEENQSKFLQQLFTIGMIKPHQNNTTESKVFKAHIKGIKTAAKQMQNLTKKYPAITKHEIYDGRLIRRVADWADFLAGQAAASCNTQADDNGSQHSDPIRCVDAWLRYDEVAIDLGMARDDLDDCSFQNSNPPITQPIDGGGPFPDLPRFDPCLDQAMNVNLLENNLNAAWHDIALFC